MTIFEAAEVLKITRFSLVKLLEEGQIPYRKVGDDRRVLLKDILEYSKKMEVTREESLAYLTQQAQELNLGY